MISVVYNEVQRAIELRMDTKGIDLLIRKLNYLKEVDGDHVHIYATNDDSGLATISPYREEIIYRELILGILPSEAWEDAAASDG
jgi:hypothetical protein